MSTRAQQEPPPAPIASPFRPQALEFHRRCGLRGDVLHMTPSLLHAVYWFVIALALCVFAFVCTAQVSDYAAGPALVLLDNRREITATRAGVVSEIVTRIGVRVVAGQPLLRLHAATETAELESLEREIASQLVLLMRNPRDGAARDALLGLRTRRDLAQTGLERSVVRAPHAGVVADLRVRDGQMVDAGAPLLALQSEPRAARVVALLPGSDRPRLRPGMPLRFHIVGFERSSLELSIERVDEQVLGPPEALRALGVELSGALQVEGPVVLVHARLPSDGFLARGRRYQLHHGMPARAEVAVQREPLLYAWLPGLEQAVGDVL